MLNWIVMPFLSRGRLDVVLLGLFLLINSMVFVNAYLHNPEKSYDGYGHMAYVKTLAVERQLPTLKESYEFFSPPLAYVLPAFVRGVFHLSTTRVAKFGQYLNVGISIFLTYFLLRLVFVMNPPGLDLRRTTLLLLGMLPVYYKTLAMGVRGEPYVALFVVMSLYVLMSLIRSKSQNLWKFELLGLLLGLTILSRQWGFLVFPAVFGTLLLVMFLSKERAHYFHGFLLTTLITMIVGGWFYYEQRIRYGNSFEHVFVVPIDYSTYVKTYPDLLDAFEKKDSTQLNLNINEWGEWHYENYGLYENRNIGQVEFSFSNQNRDFYFGTGNGNIFANPTRGAFPNQFFPIYYTEIWGDYWSYFLVSASDTVATKPIGRYLGRVNLISIIPSTLLIGGLLFGLLQVRNLFRLNDSRYNSLYLVLNTFVVVVSLIGYMWFVIRYPNPGKGDPIKATYLLHIFPPLAIISAYLLGQIKKARPFLYVLSIVLLLAVSIHNFPTFISHIGDDYIPSRYYLPDLDIPGNYD